jgi:hypothetical protein
LGEPAPVNGGPSGFRVTNSTFDNIYAEGIKIASNTYLNASGYNMFFDVGNHFNGTTSPATPVINFESSNNVSIGDLFQRTTAYSGTYPRISINDTLSIGIDSSSQMQMGTYVRETGTTQTINNNAGSTTILTFDATVIRAVRIDYTIVRDVNTRTGSFTIVASTDGTGGSLAQNDTGYQNASTGVALTATETGSTVTWQYTSTNTGISGYIHYSVTRLA